MASLRFYAPDPKRHLLGASRRAHQRARAQCVGSTSRWCGLPDPPWLDAWGLLDTNSHRAGVITLPIIHAPRRKQFFDARRTHSLCYDGDDAHESVAGFVAFQQSWHASCPHAFIFHACFHAHLPFFTRSLTNVYMSIMCVRSRLFRLRECNFRV